MQEVERVLPPEGEGATGEVPKGEEDGFPPEEEIAHARARESFLLREEGEESASVARGLVPERESFSSREEGEESAPIARGRVPERESFPSREEGEESAPVAQGHVPEIESFFCARR